MDLFPALPEELGRECLLRLPYTSRNNLTAVCRSWKATLKNPQFYQERKNLGFSEQCICLMETREYRDCYTGCDLMEWVITVCDPQQGTWETLPRLPHFPGDHHGIPRYCRCVCVNRRLVLLGGWNPNDDGEPPHTVFIYDFSSGRWSGGADMPPVGLYCACAVSPEGHVYAAGGTDIDDKALRGAAVYSVEEDEWTLLPDMNRARHRGCFGAFIDGKFFVIGGYNFQFADGIERNADVYDPKTGAWTTLQNMWTVGEDRRSFGCTVCSSDGRFYCLDNEQGVMEYDSKENVWRDVGFLPETIGTIEYCAEWCDMIFVSCLFTDIDHTSTDNVFYMLKPPAAVTQDQFFGEWVAVPIPKPRQSGVDDYQIIESVVSFEI